MGKSLLLLMIVASPAITARGDGKFFVQDKIPAGVPYQRAFLLHYAGQETLILQSKYDLPPSAAIDSLGWVVPVPAVPEIAGGDTFAARRSFLMASMRTQPRFYRISDLLPFACLAPFLGGLAFIVICLMRYPFARREESSRKAWDRQARNAVLVTAIAFVIMTTAMPSLSRSAGGGAIDVVKEEKAGIYDVKVIRGQNAEAIVEWLKENGFSLGDEDRRAFQDYADRDWCFVTAKIDPALGADEKQIVSEGMAAPLILKFASDRPVYPLALTATAGTETEILIYTLSDAKLTCGERLTLRHARQMEIQPILKTLLFQAETEQWPLLRDLPEEPMMLCKFKGRLTPAQMKLDLEFTVAPDNESYRERKIAW